MPVRTEAPEQLVRAFELNGTRGVSVEEAACPWKIPALTIIRFSIYSRLSRVVSPGGTQLLLTMGLFHGSIRRLSRYCGLIAALLGAGRRGRKGNQWSTHCEIDRCGIYRARHGEQGSDPRANPDQGRRTVFRLGGRSRIFKNLYTGGAILMSHLLRNRKATGSSDCRRANPLDFARDRNRRCTRRSARSECAKNRS